MKMDFSKFKKISSDGKSTTLKHPEGHKIIVAHHALSPEMRKQINAIPTKYSDGGPVGDGDEENTQDKPWYQRAYDTVNDALSLPDEKEAAMRSKADQAATSLEKTAGPSMPPQPRQGQAPQVTTPLNQDPMGYGTMAKGMLGGINQQIAGANQMAQAEQQKGNEQATAADHYANALADHQKTSAAEEQGIMQERQQILQDFKNDHINYKHFQESQTSGQKVQTAIGIMLGAIGSAFTGGENPGTAWLNKQIERDIDSQKAELGKRETLLSANFHRYGNFQQAKLATRMQLNDIYSSQVARAASRAMGPQAAAQAQIYIGQKSQESAQIQGQLGRTQAAISMMNGTSDPESKIRYGEIGGVIPKEDAGQMYKDVQSVKNHAAQANAIIKYFDKSDNENTLGNRALHAGFEPASVAGIQNALMPYLKDAEGRINEMELERTDKLIPRPGDSPSKIQEKRGALIDFLNEKAPPAGRLKGIGIDPQQFGRFDEQGEKKIQLGPPVK